MRNSGKIVQKLNLNFNDSKLLNQAFTHRSYLNEAKNKKLTSNERLEFLGDSILSFVSANFFYGQFKSATEGTLTTLRAQIVQTKTLAAAATALGLGDYLLLSKGEELSDGRENETLLANAFEALIGAIFLDQGIEAAEKFINYHLLQKYQRFAALEAVKDYKSALQKAIQDRMHISPTYKTVSELGQDHAKIFKVAVYANSQQIGTGTGKSKQQAEQQAAKDALERNGIK